MIQQKMERNTAQQQRKALFRQKIHAASGAPSSALSKASLGVQWNWIRGACKHDSHFFLTLSFLFLTLLILKKRGRKKMKMFSGRRRRCSQISSFKMLKLRGRKKKNKVMMMMMMMNTSPTQPPTSNPSPNPQPKASRQLVERQVLAITAFSDETCYH